jgi:hypothetical protein
MDNTISAPSCTERAESTHPTMPGFWVPCLESDAEDAWSSDWERAPAMVIRVVVFWLLKTGRPFTQRRIMLWAGRSAPYVRPIIASAREMFAAWTAKTGSAHSAHTQRTLSAHPEPVKAGNTEEVAHTQRTLSAHSESAPLSTSRARETDNRNRSTNSPLSVEEVLAIPLPETLHQLAGYRERFTAWLRIRPGMEWRQCPSQIQEWHLSMARAHQDGRDVLGGLELAHQRQYRHLTASKLARLQGASEDSRPPGAPSEEWTRVQDALLRWGRLPPGRPEGHPDHWKFRNDPAEERAFHYAICAAAQEQDLTLAWMVLWNGGNEEKLKWQRIKFENAFKKRMRGVA